MIDKRQDCLIMKEFSDEQKLTYFSYKQKSFLHNIDTFYYSVKFENDFRRETKDSAVLELRDYFEDAYKNIKDFDSDYIKLGSCDKLVLLPITFSRFYSVCLSDPEYFHIFLAPIVPSSGGDDSVTSEVIVQIRSYFLWQFGVRHCIDHTMEIVEALARKFNLTIKEVKENRCDYCWHTNYFDDPESFFTPENFYKMRVDRFKGAQYVTNKVGSENYEIDYVALGKRSGTCFLRIYQKSREVIEQAYKPWFLKIWQMYGLISNYDFYCYEKAYKKNSWQYRFFARLEFYLEYGKDPEMIQKCKDILSGDFLVVTDDLIKFCDKLTPKLHYIINVEYQVMRKHSKSYALIPFKDHSADGYMQRVYTYLDNRKIITDYLTNQQFRLTVYDPDVEKPRREMCPFWLLLRRAKSFDTRMTSKHAKLVRKYNSQLSKDALKKRFINSAVTLGLYNSGDNDNNPLEDAMAAIVQLNDNDVHNAMQYRKKRLRQLNKDDLAEVYSPIELPDMVFVDNESGESYSYYTLKNLLGQGGAGNDDI